MTKKKKNLIYHLSVDIKKEGTDWMGITSKKSKAESVENFSTDSALSTLPFITFTPYHLYTLLPLHVIHHKKFDEEK